MNLVRSHNRLTSFSGRWLHSRCFQSSKTGNVNDKLILEHLRDREVIRVKGDEVGPFLQGLITNDIKHLHPSSNKAIYAMFLNETGRVMYDTILYSTSEPTSILIECDKNIANELQRYLKLYRVRRKIDIDSLKEKLTVWQAYETNKEAQNIMDIINRESISELIITADPRVKKLGIRLLAPNDKTFTDISKIFKQQTDMASNEKNFRLHRYSLGIAEGVSDMPPGKCFPLETNCDILNGVSFHKGCYIGQELTARVHHTGVIRKRHMPVRLTTAVAGDTKPVVQNEAGANCGLIYGSLADRALGLLRVEKAIKAKGLLVNGNACFTEIPQWWPQELQLNVTKNVRKDI